MDATHSRCNRDGLYLGVKVQTNTINRERREQSEMIVFERYRDADAAIEQTLPYRHHVVA